MVNAVVYITNAICYKNTLASMLSLKTNKNRDISYKVYIICIEFNNLYDIEKLQSNDFQIIPVYIEKNIFKKIDNAGVVYYKLLLHYLIPEKKVLYLDSDTIILEDISDTFNIKVDTIAGVMDPIKALRNINVYINCGVILFNLHNIRAINDTNEYIKLIEIYDNQLRKYYNTIDGFQEYFYEQDIYNKMYKDKMTILPYAYNFLPFTFYNYKMWYNTYEEKINLSDIKIIHYATIDKQMLNKNMYPYIRILNMYKATIELKTYSVDKEKIKKYLKCDNMHFLKKILIDKDWIRHEFRCYRPFRS